MITKKAYAKINLILNVYNKRENGYHEIDFLMTSIDLYDTVSIIDNNIDDIVVEGYNIPKDKNIAYLAMLEMKKLYNIKDKLKIIINKKIPIGGGMAGGSTNCAAVIHLINEKYNLNLSNKVMAEIGIKFGSDVYYCIYSKLSRVKGIGDQLELIDTKLNDMYIVVINPEIFMSTKKVYDNYVNLGIHGDIDSFLKTQDYSLLHNDLENVAINLNKNIDLVYEYMKEIPRNKMILSGSGSSVLMFFDKKNEANKAYEYAKKKYKLTYLVKIK